MGNSLNIAVLSAMPEEIGAIKDKIKNPKKLNFGDFEILEGTYKAENRYSLHINLKIAWSGWGKVSSARAATRLISQYNKENPLDLLLFTGVAGSASKDVHQWDIVFGEELMQHDMDARPIFEKYEIPSLNKKTLRSNKNLIDEIILYLTNKKDKKDNLEKFGEISKGKIATGDRFISDKLDLKRLVKEIPGLKAVEMEGASVAQVAEQEQIPWLIMRVISDEADELAPQIFKDFLHEYKKNSWELIRNILEFLIDKNKKN